MAGVNNVSTYNNASENSNNTALEHTNKTVESDDNDDSLQNVIDNELSKRLDECKTSTDRVKYSVDIMLAAESIHSDDVEQPDDFEYSDLKSLKSNDYQIQKDTSELLLLTEKKHAEETCNIVHGSEIVLELNQIKSDVDNDDVLYNNLSSEFDDSDTSKLMDQNSEYSELEEPRIFTRPLPVDESDNVTELVFDTWTTVDEIMESDVNKIETNGHEEYLNLNISTSSPNQECSANTSAITNSVVSFCLIINIDNILD